MPSTPSIVLAAAARPECWRYASTGMNLDINRTVNFDIISKSNVMKISNLAIQQGDIHAAGGVSAGLSEMS